MANGNQIPSWLDKSDGKQAQAPIQVSHSTSESPSWLDTSESSGPDLTRRPSWWDTVKNWGGKTLQAGWDVTPPGMIGKAIGTLPEQMLQDVTQRRQENLSSAAQGQPQQNSEAWTTPVEMSARTLGAIRGMVSPKGAALTAGAIAAPEVVGPYLIGEGIYHAGKPWIAPEDNQSLPEKLEESLSGASEAIGGQVTRMSGPGPIRTRIAEAAMEEPDTAMLKAMGVTPNSPKAAKALADARTAKPYMNAPKTQAELQSTAKAGGPARNEIWDQYDRALHQVGGNTVQGPDGPASVADLENERQQLSAINARARRGNPDALQEIRQQGRTLAQSLEREETIRNAIDPQLASTGLDPKLTRATMGGVKGVSRRIEGRLGGLETSPSGIGRMVKSGRLYIRGGGGEAVSLPENLRADVWEGLKDIAAGRGMWTQRPADVAVREGFRNPEAKPNLWSNVSNPGPGVAPTTNTGPISPGGGPPHPPSAQGGASVPSSSTPPPTDLSVAPRTQPEATVLPEQIRPDFVDESVHPWQSDERVAKKQVEIQGGQQPTIVARENPDGTVSPVKGHQSPVAASREGSPVNVVNAGPITDGEKAAMTAESHFFPQDDRPVPADLGKDAENERDMLPEEVKAAPALPAKEGPDVRKVQRGNDLPEQLPALRPEVQEMAQSSRRQGPEWTAQQLDMELRRVQDILRNPRATEEEKQIAAAQLRNYRDLANQFRGKL